MIVGQKNPLTRNIGVNPTLHAKIIGKILQRRPKFCEFRHSECIFFLMFFALFNRNPTASDVVNQISIEKVKIWYLFNRNLMNIIGYGLEAPGFQPQSDALISVDESLM